MTSTTDPALLHGPFWSHPQRPLVRAASLSLLLHGALVSLALLGWAHRAPDPTTMAPLLTAPQLIWLGREGESGDAARPSAPAPGRLQPSAQSTVDRPPARNEVPPPQPKTDPDLMLVVPTLPEPGSLGDLPGTVTSLMISDGSPPGSALGVRAGSGRGTGQGVNGGDRDGSGDRGSGPGGVIQPTLILQVQPAYTADALHARAQGIVTVDAIVNSDGSVGDVRVVRTFNPSFGLDGEAVRAVKQWRFHPGRRSGRAVPMYVTVELTFSLR